MLGRLYGVRQHGPSPQICLAMRNISVDAARRVLNISEAEVVTSEEVKRAYRQRALELHPDRNPTSDGEGFKELKKGYDVALFAAKHQEVVRAKEDSLKAWKSDLRKNRKNRRSKR